MDSAPPSSDEETWDEWRARQAAVKLQRPGEPSRLVYIRSLCDPALQKYIDDPPGAGKSVIYVIVNVKDGKALSQGLSCSIMYSIATNVVTRTLR